MLWQYTDFKIKDVVHMNANLQMLQSNTPLNVLTRISEEKLWILILMAAELHRQFEQIQ